MAVILNNKKSTYGSPYCYYTVEYTDTTNRTATSVDITFKITSHLAYSSSSLGTGRSLIAQLYINGAWSNNITLKASSDSWSGTSNHTKTQTLTITGLSSTDTTLSGIKFKVNSSAGDNACGLNSTSCSDITIPTGHTPPKISSYTMIEMNSALSGVAGNVIAENLSKKRFTVTYTLYDGATISRVGIYNGVKPYSTTTYTQVTGNTIIFDLDCSQFSFDKSDSEPTKIPIVVRIIDSFDTMGTKPAPQTPDLYSYIPYTLPTITDSGVIVKRIGQTSGRVGITLSGNYYNGTVGNTNQGGTYKPTIKYKYWETGTTEPTTYANTIPSGSITISNGTFSVNNYDIGSTTTSASNYFDPEKSYRVKIQVNDTFKTYELSEAKSVPLGEALWTEYKDRVDFKKLTINKKQIITTQEYTLYTGATASNSVATLTYNIAKTGYTPISITGISCEGTRSSFINIYASIINNSAEAEVRYRNTNTSSALVSNDTLVRIIVAYIKD